MKFVKEFRDFTLRGNVLDLAVGIVIGAAFSSIVSAIVDNLLMPVIGMLTGGVNFTSLAIKVGKAELKYGMLIQAIITFLIIASFLFAIVKFANTMRIKTPVTILPSKTEQLLESIYHEMAALRKELKSTVSPHVEEPLKQK